MRRIFPIALLILVVFVGGVYWFAGTRTALEFALEQAAGAGITLKASELRGNLFTGLEAKNATIKSNFLNGSGSVIRAKYNVWNLISNRELGLDLQIEDGSLTFDPSKLPAVDPNAPPPSITVSITKVATVNTNVALLGKNISVPDVAVSILENESLPGDKLRGNAKLKLETKNGTGTAKVRYEFDKQFNPDLDIEADLDATIAKYWYKPIRAGRIRGTAKVTANYVTLKATVENGALEPVEGLLITNVTGRAGMSADGQVHAKLNGRGLDSKVRADISVDTRAGSERFDVIGSARPSVRRALEVFAPGTAGTGALEVTVRGGGWEKLALRGTAKGAGAVSAAGFPLNNFEANWTFKDRLELTANADSSIGSDRFKLNATVRNAGERVLIDATANGVFVRSPLRATANITTFDGITKIAARGEILRGKVSTNLTIDGERISGSGTVANAKLPVPPPVTSSLNSRVRISGTTDNIGISGLLEPAVVDIPGIKTRNVAGRYDLRVKGGAVSGKVSLAGGQLEAEGEILRPNGGTAKGVLRVQRIALEPAGLVDYSAEYELDSKGVRLDGEARGYGLAFSGVQLDSARGRLTVDAGERISGRWDADKLLATFTDERVRLQPNNWGVVYADDTARLNGDLTLEYRGLTTSGVITATSKYGLLRGTGRGERLALEGQAGYANVQAGLRGSVDFEPFSVELNATPRGQNLQGVIAFRAGKTVQISGEVRTKTERLKLEYDGQTLNAVGGVDFAALKPFLPRQWRGSLSGQAQVNIVKSNGTGTIRANIQGVPIEARVRSNALTLSDWRISTEARITGGAYAGMRLSGAVYPRLDASVSYRSLTGRIRGDYDDLSFGAFGELPPLQLLEDNGIRLNQSALRANGRYRKGQLQLEARLGSLRASNIRFISGVTRADISGDLDATYQGQLLAVRQARGQLELRGNTIKLEAKASAVSSRSNGVVTRASTVQISVRGTTQSPEGTFAFGALETSSSGVETRLEQVRGTISNGQTLTAQINAARGAMIYQNERLQLGATTATARVSGSNLTAIWNAPLQGRVADQAVRGAIKGDLRIDLEQPSTTWGGQLDASVIGTDFKARAVGPWNSLRLEASAPTGLARVFGISVPLSLQSTVLASGRASLPSGAYDIKFGSSFGATFRDAGVTLEGAINGRSSTWALNVNLRNQNGGSARLEYASDNTARLRFDSFDTKWLTQTETRLLGEVRLERKRLRGAIGGDVAGFPIQTTWFENGAFRGRVGGPFPLDLSANSWQFPTKVTLNVVSGDNDLPLKARGIFDLGRLRGQGQLEILPYIIKAPGGELALEAQRLPFQVGLNNGLRLRLESEAGAVRLKDDAWGGFLGLRYRAWSDSTLLTMAFTGALAQPEVAFETNGALEARGRVNPQKSFLNGSLQLEPLSRGLPTSLRGKLQPGQMRFTSSINDGAFVSTIRLEDARVDGENANLRLDAKLENGVWRALGNAGLGSSASSFTADAKGLRISDLDLDLRLLRLFGYALEGKIRGDIELPNYAIDKARGALQLEDGRAFGANLAGNVSAEGGRMVAALQGSYNAKPLELRGELYPILNADLRFDELRGRATGSRLEFADRRATMQLDGTLFDKVTKLETQLAGNTATINASWDAATLEARGNIAELSAQGTLNAPDLRGIVNVAGSARGSFSWRNDRLDAKLEGSAASLRFTSQALFENGELRLENTSVNGDQLNATARGSLYPKLNAAVAVDSRDAFVPGQFGLRASGTLEQPIVVLTGVLGAAKQGLIAPDTRLNGRFDGKNWALELIGTALAGTIEGNLNAVKIADLRINAPIVVDNNRLRAEGALSWSERIGFRGNVTAKGEILGANAVLWLYGRGNLEATLNWRGGWLRAVLPPRIADQLQASAQLERFDVGALWNKPEALFVQGSGALSGTWSAPRFNFVGSSSGVVTTSLEAIYQSGAANLSIAGNTVNLQGQWRDGKWNATGRLRNANLELILPLAANRFELSTDLSTSGDSTSTNVRFTNAVLQADWPSVGRTRAVGEVSFDGVSLEPSLRVEALGGTVQTAGHLGRDGQALTIRADGLSLEPLGWLGQVRGALELRGQLTDPTLSGGLEGLRIAPLNSANSSSWIADVAARATGRALNPDLEGEARFAGSANGTLSWAMRNALSKIPFVTLEGEASVPLNSSRINVNVALEGELPKLKGQLEAGIGSERIRIESAGDGAYRTRIGNTTEGIFKLDRRGLSWLESVITGTVPFAVNIASFVGLEGQASGVAQLGGRLFKPNVALENTQVARDDASLSISGGVYPVLDARGILKSTWAYAPGTLSWGALGSWTKPQLEISGTLSKASIGLIAPDTKIDGSFDGTTWNLALDGSALSGSLEGTLERIKRVSLKLNAPIQFDDTKLEARGALAWADAPGFTGRVLVDGTLLGQTGRLELNGQNALRAQLGWRGGTLGLTLPGQLSKTLNANVQLERFDIGAFWDKPNELQLAGTGTATGTWTQPNFAFSGDLKSREGSLDSSLNFEYSNNRFDLNANGKHLAFNGSLEDVSLDNMRWQARGNFERVALAPLLPETVKALMLSGSVEASGDRNAARVNVGRIELSGDAAPIGVFALNGALTLDAKLGEGVNGGLIARQLEFTGLGGSVVLDGQLGQGSDNLSAIIKTISLESLGAKGIVNGNLRASGTLSDPRLTGNLQTKGLRLTGSDWNTDLNLSVSERLYNPDLSGVAVFSGGATGRVEFNATKLFSSAPAVGLRGTVITVGENSIQMQADLNGTFPKLRGKINLDAPRLAVESAQLEGLGDGRYNVRVGTNLAQGQIKLEVGKTLFETSLNGVLALDAQLDELLSGSSGAVNGEIRVLGTLQKPVANLAAKLENAIISGIELLNADLNANWNDGLTASAKYVGGVISLKDNQLSVQNLPISAAGAGALLSANGTLDPLVINYNAALSDAAQGTLTGRWSNNDLETAVDATLWGLKASGRVVGNTQSGWLGAVKFEGLPKTALINPQTNSDAGTAVFNVTGSFNNPIIVGASETLGARVTLEAKLSPLQANLKLSNSSTNGDQVQASGEAKLEASGRLSGNLLYKDGPLELRIAPTGTLQNPSATITAGLGRLRANGAVGFVNGTTGASIDLTDGSSSGRFTFDRGRVNGRAQNIDLSALGLEGYGGLVTFETDLIQDTQTELGWRGTTKAVWTSVKTPITVPALGWKVDGTGRANLELGQGSSSTSVTFDYQGSPGSASGGLRLQNGLWRGSVKLDLRGAQNQGVIRGNIDIGDGIKGSARAENVPITMADVTAIVSGEASFTGEEFDFNINAVALGGRVRASGGGGLADLLPALYPYVKTKPGDLGYALNVTLDDVRFEQIPQVRQFVPYAKGRATGTAQITDGVGSFDFFRTELNLPDHVETNGKRITITTRLRGSFDDRQVRYNAAFSSTTVTPPGSSNINLDNINLETSGESTVSGTFDGTRARGTLDLRRAPLHAFIGASFGALPGGGIATGVMRYDIPIGDLVNSEIKAHFQPLEIVGGGDTLRGTVTATYKNGDLNLEQLALRGRGSWTGSGRYSRDLVNLRLNFFETTFTPILEFIPVLRDYDPRAGGSLQLELGGRYGAPDATLEIRDLKGSLSNIAFSSERFDGSLVNGNFEIKGAITTDETLGATVQTIATAKVTSFNPIKVEGLEGRATGRLNVRPIGVLDNIDARVYGDSGGFKLEATGLKGAPFSLRGNLSPVIKLRLEGSDLIVPIPEYFVSDSLMDVSLSFEGDGSKAYNVGGNIVVARLQTALNQGENAPKRVAQPQQNRKNPFLEQIKFRSLRLTAPRGIRINESFVNTEVGGALTVTGSMAAPELTGRLESIGGAGGRGNLRLGVNNYTIQNAIAEFSTVEGIYPVVRINANTEVTVNCVNSDTKRSDPVKIDATLGLVLRWVADPANPQERRISLNDGLSDRETTVSGECPRGYDPLDKRDLYNLVIFGRANSTIGGIAQQSLDTFLNVFILDELRRRIKEETGVDLNITTDFFEQIVNQTDANGINPVFTFTIGADLSKAVRFDGEINTRGQGNFNINVQSDDGRFGIRFSTPFDLTLDPTKNTTVFSSLKPEVSGGYNFSSTVGLSVGMQFLGTEIRFKLGVSFKF